MFIMCSPFLTVVPMLLTLPNFLAMRVQPIAQQANGTNVTLHVLQVTVTEASPPTLCSGAASGSPTT